MNYTKEISMSDEKNPILCPICHRELGDINIDQHHLTPKSKGRKEQYYLHKICHRKIHATFTISELNSKFNNWEELRNHPDMIVFIEWVQKKSPGWYSGSVTSNKKAKKP